MSHATLAVGREPRLLAACITRYTSGSEALSGSTMSHLVTSFNKGHSAPTLVLVAVALLASWMGNASGGYFVGGWAPVALVLAVLVLVASTTGLLRVPESGWGALALGLFTAYTAWTFASLLWSANRSNAWMGAGQTLLYLLAFWIAVVLVSQRASRRWVLTASVVGPAVLGAATLYALPDRLEEMFSGSRLLGTVGYINGEAAFLLVPFWAAIYLSGSRRVNPFVRGATLASALLALDISVLTQSRGAAAALVFSLPVYFLISGQRLRGLFALAPVVAALVFTFPGLNAVYADTINGGSPVAALERVIPTVWSTAAIVGGYGLLWGLLDRQWRLPAGLVRFVGGIVLAATIIAVVLSGFAFVERFGDPTTFAREKWTAFKTDDTSGQAQSRYLSASGSGRYVLWQTAVKGFSEHPLLGVGTNNYEATYYQDRPRFSIYARQPHTLPLEVLVERGVVGGVLFFMFLLACLAAGLRERFGRLNSEGGAQVGAMSAAIAYWFVHSSVEWFWQLPAITLPAILYLAMLVAPWHRGEGRSFSWPLRAGAVLVSLLAIAAILPLYVSNLYLQRSYSAVSPGKALSSVQRAQEFDPVDPHLYDREAELAIEAGDYKRVEEAYRTAIRKNPRHYENYMFLAKFYERRGEPEKASKLYKEALNRNPLDPQLKQKVDQLSNSTRKRGS